jgi:ABC-type glutathione transport system ATPase component
VRLFAVRDLNKRFKSVAAVREASFMLEEGEALGLVGESGSGKSTLAKIAARLLDTDSGHIFYENEDVTRMSQKELGHFRQRVQIVFQNPFSSFDPRLSLGESLADALRLSGIKDRAKLRETVDGLLSTVDLPADIALRLPHQVSGGECQRAAIARALSRDPKLLICDEPVSSLDLLAQARVLNLLLRLQKERGMSLLFISHDLRVIRHLCDRVLVMKDGLICEEGSISQVFEKPQHPYTQELLKSSGLTPAS